MPQKKDQLIRQSNALTSSAYDLGRNAKRVLYLSLIQLHKKTELDRTEVGYKVTIKHNDYKDISDEVTDINRAVRKAVKELNEKSVTMFMSEWNSDDNKGVKVRSWINGYDYNPKAKKTLLYFNSDVVEMIPYKKGLPFTQYLLISASNLKNQHVMRLYELICQWRNTRTSLKIEINWLIDRFNLPKSYSVMADFRTKFIKVAKEEITEKTDINFLKWDEHCEGDRKNTVTHITIFWTEKKSNLIDLESKERQKLETQSDAVVAELVAMEDAILSIEDMDAFNRIMITGYQTTAKECGYQIPKNIADKIKSLL